MKKALLVAAATLAAAPAWADEFDRINILVQEEFRLLSEDLGGALSYRAQTPTTPLGTTGFDLGFAVTGAKLHNTAVVEKATSDKASSTLPVPSLRLHKGLPLGFDVGVMYAAIPDSNVRYYGGELRYALVQGGAAVPAIGLRGSLTKLTGVDQLGISTRGLDLSISKGFVFVTPYAGIGRVWVTSEPRGSASFLAKEEFSLNRAFVGFGFNLAVLNINLEADKTGDVTGYSVKAGLRF